MLAAVCSLYACDDSAVIPPEDDLGLGRLRDAYVPPILDASGPPVIPVLDAAASDPRGGQEGGGGHMGTGGQSAPGGQPDPGGANPRPCPDGEIWISNRCELMCFDDLSCPEGTRCNAQDVCLEPPDCAPGEDCTNVCIGWCVGGDRPSPDPDPGPDPDPDPSPDPDPDPDPAPCLATCQAGEARCLGALISRCELDDMGCPRWSGSMPCENGTLCENGSCEGEPACQDECFADQRECVDGEIRRCAEVEPGCFRWGAAEPCPGDTVCEFNQCRCDDECVPTQRECIADGFRTCVRIDGCGRWGPVEACRDGMQCQAGLCRPPECVHECDFVGVDECVGDLVRSCERDANRCRYWSAALPCPEGRVCRPEGCVFVCEDECPFVGSQRCDGERDILLCDRDPVTQCRQWRPFTACNEGQRCEEGRCFNR